MSEPDGESKLPRNALALAACVWYGLMTLASVAWLWLRGRSDVLSSQATGEVGPWLSLLAGSVAGFGISGVIWLMVRYLPPFARLESRLQDAVGDLAESEIVVIALTSAIGEELFFRGALQDQVGPYFSTLIFGLLHAPALLIWGLVATALGFCFAMMIEAGLGFLSVTVAHALINFISLRRMVPS